MNYEKLNVKVDKRVVRYFIIAVMALSFAQGLSASIYANYFSQVYHVDSIQRGLLEIPREMPGVLCVVLIAALSSIGNLTTAILAYISCFIGLTGLGLMTPGYAAMQFLIFMFSLGEHMMMPLRDSICIGMSSDGKTGTLLGIIKSRQTMGSMAASVLVFVCFKLGVFWFRENSIVPSFIVGIPFILLGIYCFSRMMKLAPALNTPEKKADSGKGGNKTHIRKVYTPYYIMNSVFGCQKRMRLVFAPWLIVELLGAGADTLALLGILNYLIATRVSPIVGKTLDRRGSRYGVLMESVLLCAVFLYGGFTVIFMVPGANAGSILCRIGVYAAYILVMLTDQAATVHTFLMKKIAVDPSDVKENLSMGVSLDHVLAVTVSGMMGFVWKVYGPQYTFFISALLCIGHFAVGMHLKKDDTQYAA